MANLIQITPVRTYANRENAQKAVEKKIPADRLTELRYFIHQHIDGRFFPVFIGQQALQHGIHFHFNVVG